MVSVGTIGREIDYEGNSFAESTVYFFGTILSFLFEKLNKKVLIKLI